jgi:signal transduction histidine kinase
LRTLSRDRFPWLSFSAGGVQTARGETWIQTPQTIVRVATSELDRAFADEHYQPAVQLFDIMDGLPGSATFFNRSGLTEDPQGRIWVATDHGIAVADPHALPHNPLAPPVAITAVRTAGGLWSNQGKVELPPATTRVEIDFTGLSFVNPERLCFRYRLSGVDRSWVDTGNRRQALYTNLAPGQYRFQVIAANNDGVWNAQGASLDIVIRPTFFASPLAYILGAVVLMALASTLYLLRMRAVAANVRSKIAIRIHERERIARDLHDTLLQSVQGVFLRFQAFSDHLAKDDPAREKLEDTLERAQQVVDEARDRVFALRDPGDRIPVEEIVAQAMATIPLFTTARVETRIASHLPALRIELAKEAQAILSEALFNVERHACATHVIICAEGGDRRIRLSVRDDGKGIPADIIEAGERPGHFGLIGMRERARHIDGYLSIANLSGRGAEIVLSFPCADLAGAKGLQDTVHVLGRWLRRHLLRK